MWKKRTKLVLWLVTAMTLSFGLASNAGAPGPGADQCSPGQNNVGGGSGNSGTGDKAGAPLKAPPQCPGNDH